MSRRWRYWWKSSRLSFLSGWHARHCPKYFATINLFNCCDKAVRVPSFYWWGTRLTVRLCSTGPHRYQLVSYISKRGTGNLSGLEETCMVWRRLASGHFCAIHGITQCLGPVEIEDRDWFLLSPPCLNFPLLYLWWCKYHRKYLLHSKRRALLLNLTARVGNTPKFTKTLRLLSYCALSVFVWPAFQRTMWQTTLLALYFPCDQLLQPKLIPEIVNCVLFHATDPEQCMAIIYWKQQKQKLKTAP